MPTPNKEEMTKKAIDLWMKDNHITGCYNTPTYQELLEGNYIHRARIELMKTGLSCPEYEKHLWQCFDKLIDDCKVILSNAKKSTLNTIRRWHKIGERILNDESYSCGKWGSQEFVIVVAYELSVSKSSIYSALKFAKKFPDLEKFLTSQKLCELTPQSRDVKSCIVYGCQNDKKSIGIGLLWPPASRSGP